MRAHRPIGFFVVDAVIGLAVMVAVAALVAVLVHDHAQASRRLSDRLAAVRAAEQALTDLQFGRADRRAAAAGTTVTVAPAGGAAPDGTRWVTVTARYAGGEVVLYGLARADALPPTDREAAP